MDPFVTLPTVLDLGIPVVGSATYPSGDPYPSYMGSDETTNIQSIGYLEPNLETIAALQPDLIIGYAEFIEPVYEQLSQIAPTVPLAFTSTRGDWKKAVRDVADVFGRREVVDQQIDAYEQRIEEFKTAMGDRLDSLEVSFIRIVPDEIRIHTKYHFAGQILDEAGLRRPAAHDVDDPEKTLIQLSLEQLPQIDADVIFYVVAGGGHDPQSTQLLIQQVQQNPLWTQLRAVQNKRVYQVDESYWLIGGVDAANAILDDLFKYLVEEPQ